MSDADFKRWQAFLTGETAPAVETETTQDPARASAPEPAPEEAPRRVVLTSGSMSFKGSAEDILLQVRTILGGNYGNVTITWNFEED